MMLVSLQFQISYASYPNISLAVLIFAISSISFLFGHCFTTLIVKLTAKSQIHAQYEINPLKLRQFNFLLAVGATGIVVMNLVTSGIPPFFGFFGINTLSYIEYGKLRQLLFPLLVTLFVNSFLDPSKLRRTVYATFAFFALLCYLARGSIMIMMLQVLIVFSIRTSLSKKKLYFISICGAICAALFIDFIGSNRTGDQIFFLYMQIKTQFQNWPTAYLWIISYVSTPLSNLCWFVDTAHFNHIAWSFAYPLLPHFLEPVDPHMDIIETSRIIDGVHTYLSSYFLDFSYFGIFIINFAVGIVSGYCNSAQRISRKFLPCAVFLSSIAFMFFTDYFATLQTVLELGIQSLAQWYFMKEFTFIAPKIGMTEALLTQSSGPSE